MCLFRFQNNSSIKAKQKGIEYFECGHCPECLQKKSRIWALRTCMEAKNNVGCMVTLTYDTYKYNYTHSIEENPPDPTIPLSKRDCQLFIKRLRKHFKGKTLRYLLTAERGRKGRAHYHALLFGVQFNDLVRYKKSDRGNWIYKSHTLEKIWKNGICTVDCINLSAKTARYCTKYCAKDSGSEETFMLFSRGIGEYQMLKEFNGKNYWIDGREYSIPKQVWQTYICNKYNLYNIHNKKNVSSFAKYMPLRRLEDTEKTIYTHLSRQKKKKEAHIDKFKRADFYLKKKIENQPNFRKSSTRRKFMRICSKYIKRKNICADVLRSIPKKDNFFYISLEKLYNRDKSFNRGKTRNQLYQYYRDNDVIYKRYLSYWKSKGEQAERMQLSTDERIISLPDKKYWRYKQHALTAISKRRNLIPFVPPRSKCKAFSTVVYYKDKVEQSFALLSRHLRANDTTKKAYHDEYAFLCKIRQRLMQQDMSAVVFRQVY